PRQRPAPGRPPAELHRTRLQRVGLLRRDEDRAAPENRLPLPPPQCDESFAEHALRIYRRIADALQKSRPEDEPPGRDQQHNEYPHVPLPSRGKMTRGTLTAREDTFQGCNYKRVTTSPRGARAAANALVRRVKRPTRPVRGRPARSRRREKKRPPDPAVRRASPATRTRRATRAP